MVLTMKKITNLVVLMLFYIVSISAQKSNSNPFVGTWMYENNKGDTYQLVYKSDMTYIMFYHNSKEFLTNQKMFKGSYTFDQDNSILYDVYKGKRKNKSYKIITSNQLKIDNITWTKSEAVNPFIGNWEHIYEDKSYARVRFNRNMEYYFSDYDSETGESGKYKGNYFYDANLGTLFYFFDGTTTTFEYEFIDVENLRVEETTYKKK